MLNPHWNAYRDGTRPGASRLPITLRVTAMQMPWPSLPIPDEHQMEINLTSILLKLLLVS